ncbi:MAG: type II toxin-antitoxin system RelE/ParE family toxin [Thermodesulfovibrionales bacterium]|nr:type II toxin-antitoxin system RelE/ParE family toxin [Thermodesulfovibrionales bacterium]
MEWIVDYYRDAKGKEPVREFLNSLSLPAKTKTMRLIEFLTEHGVLLKEPYTRHIKGKIRELRIKDRQGAVRILYFTYSGKRFILLHGFIKKTEKTPEREIEIAEKRMNDYINTLRR